MLTPIVLASIAESIGGEIFYLDRQVDSIVSMNTRDMSSTTTAAPIEASSLMWNIGMAYDPTTDGLWMYGPTRITPYMECIRLNIASGTVDFRVQTQRPQYSSALAITRNSIGPTIFDEQGEFAYNPLGGVYYSVEHVTGADWYDPGGYVIAHTRLGDFYSINTMGNSVSFLASSSYNWQLYSELAFDSDTNIL